MDSEQQEIVDRYARLEKIVSVYAADGVGTTAKNVKEDCGISTNVTDFTSENLADHFEHAGDEHRLLTIGFVGRVKAGKSSLQNALFFDGRSVLPEAVTPMTASLTILEHGEKNECEIAPFTNEGFEEIRKNHDEVKNAYDAKEREFTERGEITDAKEIENKAWEIVKKEQGKGAMASYEHYEKLLSLCGGEKPLPKEKQTIEAPSEAQLIKMLKDYVGVNGSQTYYTKSLTLRVKTMKDGIRVVDTPGLNDPVQSRSARTSEFLMDCDVLFVVIPVTQFLNADEALLISNLVQREGKSEIYIVGTKTDDLMSNNSVIQKSMGSVISALKAEREELSPHAVKCLPSRLKSKILEGGQDSLILTSAICHSMLTVGRVNWSEGMQHTYEQLQKYYPDNFCDGQTARETLKTLAGIGDVMQKVDAVRARKDDIIKTVIASDKKAWPKKVDRYAKELLKALDKKIEEIENANEDTLIKETSDLERLVREGTQAIDSTFEDCVESLGALLLNKIEGKADELYENALAEIQNAKSLGYKAGGFLYLGKKQEIIPSEIYTILTTYINDWYNTEKSAVIKVKAAWKKDVQREILSSIKEVMGDEYVDISNIKGDLNRLCERLKEPDLTGEAEEECHKFRKSGDKLFEDEADRFIADRKQDLSNLKSGFDKQKWAFFDQVKEATKEGGKMSFKVFEESKKRMEEKKKIVANKAAYLMQMKLCRGEIEKIVDEL